MKKLLILFLFAGFSATAQTTPCDSLKRVNDSLQTKLTLLQYKMERIRYYIIITDRKPSQRVYFRGWIKRVMN